MPIRSEGIHPIIQAFLQAREAAVDAWNKRESLEQRKVEAENERKQKEADLKQREAEVKQRMAHLKEQLTATEKFHAAQNKVNTLRMLNEAQQIYGQTGVAPMGIDLSPAPVRNGTLQFNEDLRQGNFGNMYEMKGAVPGYSPDEAPIPVTLQTPETIGRNKLAILGPVEEAKSRATIGRLLAVKQFEDAARSALEAKKHAYRLDEIEKKAKLTPPKKGKEDQPISPADLATYYPGMPSNTTRKDVAHIVPTKPLSPAEQAKKTSLDELEPIVKNVEKMAADLNYEPFLAGLGEAKYQANRLVLRKTPEPVANLRTELGRLFQIPTTESAGKAWTAQELGVLRTFLPGLNDSPEEFKAKIGALKSWISSRRSALGAPAGRRGDTSPSGSNIDEIIRLAPKVNSKGLPLNEAETRKHGRPLYTPKSGGQ